MIVRIVSYPPDGGSFVMKSRLMVSKGSADSVGVMGNIGGFAGWVLTFVIWQVAHPLIYCVMKCFMLGHQKCWPQSWIVFVIPGCPAVVEL